MKLYDLLAKVLPALSKIEGQFAIAGGFAASVYRKQPRLTNDIDIALSGGSIEETRALAEELLESIGAKTSLGWIPGLPKPIHEYSPRALRRFK